MDLALVQIAALVANGNAWLAGDADAARRVELGSAFESVRAIRFDRQVDGTPTHAADDGGSWFRQCAALGVTTFWLEPHAHRRVGTMASILTLGAGGRERWRVSRSIAPPSATYRGGWLVEVAGSPDAADLVARRSIAEVTGDLQARVREARDLASRWGMTFWSGVLDRALGEAVSEDPTTRAHNDVLPPTAELDRRRLFALAVRSWVFGGMGTWSDQGPQDPADIPGYERISDALYDRIVEGLAAAVNPRAAPPAPAG